MKRIVLLSFTVLCVVAGFAQKQPADSTAKPVSKPTPVTPVSAPKKKKDWSSINLSNRANDHLLIQVGYDGWAQRPDTIHNK
jgi:hypothetical protein